MDKLPTSPLNHVMNARCRFELVLHGGAPEGNEWFVPVSTSGATSRVLLGRLVSPGGDVIDEVVIKLRRDDYRTAQGMGRRMAATNRTVDDAWEMERKLLLDAGGGAGGLHAGFRYLAQHGVFPPLLYCGASRQYFHPPCPECGRVLRTCRDDALLTACGLCAYGMTTMRYLYCAECAKQTHMFWTASEQVEEQPASGVRLRRGRELIEDIRPLLQATDSSLDLRDCLNAPLGGSADLTAIQPDQVQIVSYCDSELLPMRPCSLSLRDAAAVLGGADTDALQRSDLTSTLSSGQMYLRESALNRLRDGRQFFFADDASGLFPLECLLLKLRMFQDICLQVGVFHRDFCRPHGHLVPEHLMVAFKPEPSASPVRWQFATTVLDLGAVQPMLEFEGEGGKTSIYSPPRNLDAVYGVRTPLEEFYGKSEIAHVIVRTVEALSGSDAKRRARLEVDLISQSIRTRSIGRNDVLVVSLPLGAHRTRFPLYAVPRNPIENGLRCLAMATPDGTDYAALEALSNHVMHDCEITYYRSYHVPADIHSLGMVLCHLLLAHDRQDMTNVSGAIKRILGRIELALPRGTSPDPVWIEQLIKDQVRDDSRTFGRYSVLYSQDERAKNVNAISQDVWERLLVLGFRMITGYAGFSIHSEAGGFDPARPAAGVEHVLREVETVSDRLWAELFGSQPMHREILSAMDRIIDEWTEPLVKGPAESGA